MEGKLPPHSIQAEQSVLGSILIDREAMLVVSDVLQEDDFYKDAHREIFHCMMDLYKKLPVPAHETCLSQSEHQAKM